MRWRALGLLVAVLPLALLVGCGGAGEERGEDKPTRTETHPFGPTPSDAPRIKAGAPTVAALGDSITAGSPLWDPDPDVRDRNPDALNPQSQYEYWAQARLGGRLRFRNCGVLGQTTSQIAERFAACTRGARAVVIQGGINDIVQRRSVERAGGQLRAMVRAGRERGLAVVLAQVLPWNNGYPDAAPAIDRLNALIDRIGRAEGVQVLGFHKVLEDPRAPGRMREDLTLEGDHPSVPGYRLLGELVAAAPPIVRLAAPEG